tara:strand:+ start:31 stop:390 length:360 start_codon:yes stop_codon:yes gene_type:complete
MFEVGDIAYIRVSVRGESQRAVVPIKVTERLIRESLEGKVVSYVVRGPTGEDYEIDPEEEELYTRLDDAKDVIVSEAMAGVDKIINKAKMFEQRYFAKDISIQPVQSGLEKDVENITAS